MGDSVGVANACDFSQASSGLEMKHVFLLCDITDVSQPCKLLVNTAFPTGKHLKLL